MAYEGEKFHYLVNGQQRVGPVVSGAEDVPGAEDGCAEAAGSDQILAFGAHGDVGLHHGSGVSDAQVDEMRDAEFSGGVDGFAGGD